MMTLSLWKFGLLLISLIGANGLMPFPENFVVAKLNDAVTLTCRTNIDGAVTWKFDGEVLVDFKYNIKQDGQNLHVTDVETPWLGEYSCWRGGEMLSLTHLLLEAEDEEELAQFDSLITCLAKSYHCNFSCTLKESAFTAVRVGLGHDCTDGGKLCHWINSSDQNQDGGFQFEVSHSLSPYAEESTKLELTAEAIVDLYVFRTTRRFYLRDIVQPDSPQIGTCQELEQDLNVTIEPPSSWSMPHSFFGLEHEIEYVLKDDGKPARSLSSLVPKSISKLRVRSRDSLVLSTWSEWTPWKNVRTGEENLCKCRNTVKYCCPELPPGFLERCKKKRKKKKNNKVVRHLKDMLNAKTHHTL
ncbi:interleukin-12 subunit beta isoform X1 [Hippoglossus hippoglossus]|uniref:interleukin-12 subunit beta isoform X1 n=1 Tax=Hippoglossus hippoglossus TaxID=8267 RepID=UPI00148BCF37|nr:interleukin-12 subunit beta isoform X1 [Hippoglossus hippoglossus]